MTKSWFSLLIIASLSRALNHCPDKCICLWHTDRSLEVDCSGRDQKEVPRNISPQVKVLNLSYNEIKEYRHSNYLKIVEDLDLSNNLITEIGFGSSLNHLRKIDLSHNSIASLRRVDVRHLNNLKILNLSYNSKLHQVSGLMSKSLEVLDLNHCYVSYVDENFLSGLPSIQFVDLSYNSLHSLLHVQSTSLKHLDASHLDIKQLSPFHIFNLPNLTVLDVSFNPNLKIDFTYEKSCWDVKSLDLSGSQMDSLDEMFPFCSLQVLNASANRIRGIEVRTFYNNCELVSVNLSRNMISEIDARAFFTTEKLKILDLSQNQIQSVEFTLYLKQLTDLDLSENQISDFVGLRLDSALSLDLSRNHIKDSWFNLNEEAPKLRDLDLSHNKIKSLTKINSKSLTRLNLSHCKISAITEKAFDNADGLIEIDLSGNELASLDFRLFRDLSALSDLHLAGNPWDCFCQSQIFLEFYDFVTVRRSYGDSQELLCAKTNKTWKSTCEEDWQKEKDWNKTIYGSTVGLVVILIIVAIIFSCNYINETKKVEEPDVELLEIQEALREILNNYQNREQNTPNADETPEVPVRNTTPPPNYEAALLLPKLTEEPDHLSTPGPGPERPEANRNQQAPASDP